MEAFPPAAFSINSFCKAFCVGRTTTYAQIRAGRLKAVKCGKRTLIPKAAAAEWLALLERETPARAIPATTCSAVSGQGLRQ